MSANIFTDEFKRDAVAQVGDRGYPVREVAERLGVMRKIASVVKIEHHQRRYAAH